MHEVSEKGREKIGDKRVEPEKIVRVKDDTGKKSVN